MTNFARVPMSDIVKSGRIDPGFHIAAQRVATQVAALEQRLDRDAAIAAALKIAGVMEPAQLREVLDLIRRGEGKRPVDDKELARLTNDYPHLTLALLVEGAPKAQEALQGRIEAFQAKQGVLDEVLAKVAEVPVLKEKRPGVR